MFDRLHKQSEQSDFVQKPVFGMREYELSTFELGIDLAREDLARQLAAKTDVSLEDALRSLKWRSKMDLVSVGYELVKAYKIALLKATLIAAGGEVITIVDSKKERKLTIYPFVRDPVLTLPDQDLMLYTYGNLQYGAKDILQQGEEKMGYQALEVEGSYFEGGNIFYSQKRKLLLHGLNPEGRYHESFKPEPSQTNQHLSEKLSPAGISVHGLELNPLLMEYKNRRVQAYNYYHLDCFMQLLPDGRMIILNKEILSPSSQEKMKELFGDDFIDLAYPDYLSKPVLFNFIALQKNNQTQVISPVLPEYVKNALQQLQINVITPDSLNSRMSNTFDITFSEQVASVLQKEGYETANAQNLTTHVPKNVNGYGLDNGDRLSSNIRDTALGASGKPLDEYYATGTPTLFTKASGGPHCLITDIAPHFANKKSYSMPADEVSDVQNEVSSEPTHLPTGSPKAQEDKALMNKSHEALELPSPVTAPISNGELLTKLGSFSASAPHHLASAPNELKRNEQGESHKNWSCVLL